jgi:outer membrane protein assembly factor BamD (BamD/ComL family)
MQTGNYGEAATGFSEVQERFSGTPSANEAVLLLNELRLIQGQAALAAQDLEGFAPNAPRRFRVKAYMLLGAAREDAGQAIEGAVAYAAAAEAARFDYEAARALLDAGRAYTNGGDTAQAILSYRRITEDYPETAVVLDAQLRLTELEEASKAQ